MRRRAALAPVVAVLALGGTAVPAGAAQPTRETVNITDTYGIDNLCPFTITNRVTLTAEEVTYTDRNGDPVKVLVHATETDVFSANGKTLTGLPYRYNIRVVFEDGEVEHVYASGILIRVPLPSGKVFQTAGRVDFEAHPDAQFLAVPDKGRAVDLGPFCAALAPDPS